jgi:hypothetical protein
MYRYTKFAMASNIVSNFREEMLAVSTKAILSKKLLCIMFDTNTLTLDLAFKREVSR